MVRIYIECCCLVDSYQLFSAINSRKLLNYSTTKSKPSCHGKTDWHSTLFRNVITHEKPTISNYHFTNIQDCSDKFLPVHMLSCRQNNCV